MRKLKECKNFAEIYETIGEENFQDVAKLLIMLMVASPLFWGVINFSMLIDYYAYDAYEYNDKCISLMHALFSVITFWSFIYYFGKIRYEKLTIKQIVKRIKDNNPWLLPWFTLLVWTIIPIAFSVYPLGAIVGATFLSAGYVTHIFMFGILGCAALIPIEDREDVFKSFVIIADFLAIVLIAFEYEIPVLGQFAASGGMSVYTNQNHYAYYLTIACLVMVGGYYDSIVNEKAVKTRAFYIVSFALNIYILMINDTMGGYLGILFACVFMMIIWNAAGKKIGVRQIIPLVLIAIITAFSIGGLIEPSRTWEKQTTIGQSLKLLFDDIFNITHKTGDYMNAGTTRWGLWKESIEWILRRPITGYGPDIMYNEALEKFRDTPHNEYIECAFYLGIPGLVLYLGGLVTILVNKCKKLKDLPIYEIISAGASIAYLISAFFGNRKFNSVCFFFLFMGLMINNDSLKKN